MVQIVPNLWHTTDLCDEPADGLSCKLWHTADLCGESQLMV
jgi:hypothetical protein